MGDIALAQEQHRILATNYTNFSLQWAAALRQIILLNSPTELQCENQSEAAVLPENELNTVQLMDVSLKPIVLDAPAPLQPMTSNEEPSSSDTGLESLVRNDPATLNECIPSNEFHTNELSVTPIQLSANPIQIAEPIAVEKTTNQPVEQNQANNDNSTKSKHGRFGRILHL